MAEPSYGHDQTPDNGDIALFSWPCHQVWEHNGKDYPCSIEVRQRLHLITGWGMKRDDAFRPASATNAEEWMQVYRLDHLRRQASGVGDRIAQPLPDLSACANRGGHHGFRGGRVSRR